MDQTILILLVLGIIGIVYYMSTQTTSTTDSSAKTNTDGATAEQKAAILKSYTTYFNAICANYSDFNSTINNTFQTNDIFNITKNSTGTTLKTAVDTYFSTHTNPAITDFDSFIQNWFLTLLILKFPSVKMYIDASGNYTGASFGIKASSSLSASQQTIVNTFFNTTLLNNVTQTIYNSATSAYLDSVKGPAINTDIINYLNVTPNPTNQQFYSFMTTEYIKYSVTLPNLTFNSDGSSVTGTGTGGGGIKEGFNVGKRSFLDENYNSYE